MKGIIEAINAESMKAEVPAFNVGDTVKVGYKIIEGGKERIQNFEGVVIAKKNGGISETFTVRHISYGVGVEKTFPIHSPKVADIQVVRHGGDLLFQWTVIKEFKKLDKEFEFDVIFEDLNKLPLFTPHLTKKPHLIQMHHLWKKSIF